ncbi:MAG: lipoate protein ligase C-terminal domain-containing protein [Candidatus Micrarchaeota archaeon]
MRCEEKVPGGKLVCVEVWAEGSKVKKVKITGDFFLHPEDAIDPLERALAGSPLSIDEAEVAARFAKALGDAQLIGASCDDLARIFAKAVNG